MSPPYDQYRGVRQHEWGTWVVEITGRHHWLGTFHSARQAAWAHDIANVTYHGADYSELNFPLGCEEPVPDLEPVPRYMANTLEAREDREARERREVEAAGERFMADLCERNPERVARERALFSYYKEQRSGGASSPAPSSASSSSAPPASAFAQPEVVEIPDSDEEGHGQEDADAAAALERYLNGEDSGSDSTGSDDSFNRWLDSPDGAPPTTGPPAS